jgi:hypothetical protein
MPHALGDAELEVAACSVGEKMRIDPGQEKLVLNQKFVFVGKATVAILPQ